MQQKTNVNLIKKYVKKKIFVTLQYLQNTPKYSKFNQYQKSDKAPFIIYADLECLIKKIGGCKNNPENSSTTKVSEHISSDISMSTMLSFQIIEARHDICRGKDCMKKFWESLRYVIEIILKSKKMKLLTKEQQKSCENAKICYICKEKFENEYGKDKKYWKVRDHCHYTRKYRGDAHGICNLKYSILKKIPIAFQNGPNYDYDFIQKVLTEEFENAEKYITFTVPIEKEVTRIDKNGEEITKMYLNRIQFIDSARFMVRSLSNLLNNLSEGIHKIKCKYTHDDKKCETCRIKCKYCDCFLEYASFQEDLIEYKCLCCNEN